MKHIILCSRHQHNNEKRIQEYTGQKQVDKKDKDSVSDKKRGTITHKIGKALTG